MQWQSLGHSLRTPAAPLPPRTLLLLPPPMQQPLPLLRADAGLLLIRLDLLLLGSAAQLSCSLRSAAEVATGAGSDLLGGSLLLSGAAAGLSITAFAAPLLPTGHWLWLEASDPSGTISGLHLSVHLQPAAEP
jgi:hypothetical protein